MCRYLVPLLTLAVVLRSNVVAQDAAAPATSSSTKPTAHVLGTITAMNAGAHTVTIKEDKGGADFNVDLTSTKTLLKVAPGAKDLKSASRITADELAVGDRVDVRGSNIENSANAIAARVVILMSGRDLEQAHQAEASAWQHSINGQVAAVDPSAKTLSMTTPSSAAGPGRPPATIQVAVSPSTVFTRYSPETPKTPVASRLSDVQPGDQLRVIGEKSADGQSLTAQKIYSGAFRTIAATVSSISPDGKQLSIKNLQTKETMQVTLTDDSVIRKLPQMMAMGLARRLNPDFKPQGGPGMQGSSAGARGSNGTPGGNGTPGSNGPGGAGSPEGGPSSQSDMAQGGGRRGPAARGGDRSGGGGEVLGSGEGPGSSGPGGGMHRPGGGDLSQILERAPKVAITDLKPGDAVIVHGASDAQVRTKIVAASIVAGVEPIFQSAPPRSGQSLGDWNTLDMAAPAQ